VPKESAAAVASSVNSPETVEPDTGDVHDTDGSPLAAWATSIPNDSMITVTIKGVKMDFVKGRKSLNDITLLQLCTQYSVP
jgi:hypothetical protein